MRFLEALSSNLGVICLSLSVLTPQPSSLVEPLHAFFLFPISYHPYTAIPSHAPPPCLSSLYTLLLLVMTPCHMLTSEYLEPEIAGEIEHCVSGSHMSEFD